jgi:hypothetical protein
MVKVVARRTVAIIANVMVRRVVVVSVASLSLRSSKGTIVPLLPIAQKSPYAYFFVGNDYYLKLRVMHFLFSLRGQLTKRAILCHTVKKYLSKNIYSSPCKDSLLIT